MHRMRLATVPFLNAEPLLWGFRRGPYRDIASIEAIPPSGIPARLRAGTIDLGLIPVIEIQRWSELEILPHLCIAAKRRARSVLLVSRVPVDRIRSVALDENSRTSAALLRILLEHRGMRGVVYHEAAPSLRAMLRDHDAALLIGDPALRADTAGLEVLDLGGEWHAATGLPFVFAVWAIRRGATLPDGLRPFLDGTADISGGGNGCDRSRNAYSKLLVFDPPPSSVQFAAASEHHGPTHHRTTANAQFRHSNAYAAPSALAAQPEWSGYGYYSGGYSAPAGR